jgi:hypothetical protein
MLPEYLIRDGQHYVRAATPETVEDAGETLLAKNIPGYGLAAWRFPNRTAAEQAAQKWGGEVVRRGRMQGFYVRLPKHGG